MLGSKLRRLKGFRVVEGHILPRENLSFEFLKLLEMQSHHHHVILYHFKSFTIPSGGPFSLLGGACADNFLGAILHIYFRTIFASNIERFTIIQKINPIRPGLFWSSWAWGRGGGFKSPPSINPKVLMRLT